MAEHPQGAAGAMNATVNIMMKPVEPMDQIREGALIWDDGDLEEIHADAEEADSLESQAEGDAPEPIDADSDGQPDD